MRSALYSSSALLALFVAATGCDTRAGGRDASTPGTQREVAVRIDAPSGANPSVSVLAFQAVVNGVSGDVLSIVDPLVSPAPEGACELRDVAGAARQVGAQGGSVELDALDGLGIELGPGAPWLRPLPRVYPDLASVVGGVVGEAGPVDVSEAPAALTVADSAGARVVLPVPGLPRLLLDDDSELPSGAAISVTDDLRLHVSGPAQFIELRPFGATLALACPVAGERATVPASELQALRRLGGRVPVSLEAVSRESHHVSVGGGPVRLTLEVRSSSVVDLRP